MQQGHHATPITPHAYRALLQKQQMMRAGALGNGLMNAPPLAYQALPPMPHQHGLQQGDPIGIPATDGRGTTYIKGIYPPETAARICQIAIEAVKNPRVPEMARRLVRNLIDENASPFLAVYSEIQAVYNQIASRMRYTRDPFGVELVYGADFVAKQWEDGQPWADDCDTYAVMLMSFFLSIGRECRVTIVSFEPNEPERFEHVFVEVLSPSYPEKLLPSRWVVVDPSTAGKVRDMCRSVAHMRHFYPE